MTTTLAGLLAEHAVFGWLDAGDKPIMCRCGGNFEARAYTTHLTTVVAAWLVENDLMCECGKVGRLRRRMCEACYARWLYQQGRLMTTDRRRSYRRWYSMVKRCHNPADPAYPQYGGRGIEVCPEWRQDFEAFLRDVGHCPAPGLSLDRIDNDGNYEPSNVRWATASEQAQNRRGYEAGHKVQCPAGHPYDDANTRVSADGRRHCRACGREKSRRHRARKKAQQRRGAA